MKSTTFSSLMPRNKGRSFMVDTIIHVMDGVGCSSVLVV